MTHTFTASAAQRALQRACSIASLDLSDARLIRLGENALFHVPVPDVVVRIARTMDYWDDAVKEVNVSRWLADHNLPAARIYDIDQPVEADQRPVTFWRYITGQPGGRQDIATLGAMLRQLHETAAPTTFALPPEDILGRVEPRIASAPIPEDDRQFLLGLLGNLSTEVAELDFPLLPAPTHGDAHIANLMVRDDQAVLIDFERFAWGQPEWDLAMTATEYRTAKWWTDEEYAKFCRAYGWDVTCWGEGFDVLRAVHEIKMTTWLMQNVGQSAEIADEYQVRMRTLRGEPSSGWRPF